MLLDIDELARSYNPVISFNIIPGQLKLYYAPTHKLEHHMFEVLDHSPVTVFGAEIESCIFEIDNQKIIVKLACKIYNENYCIDCHTDLRNLTRIGEFCCKCWTMDEIKIKALRERREKRLMKKTVKIGISSHITVLIRPFTTYPAERWCFCKNGCYECDNGVVRYNEHVYEDIKLIGYKLV